MKFMKQLAMATGLAACLPILASADLLVVEAESSNAKGSAYSVQVDNDATPSVSYLRLDVQELVPPNQSPGSANQLITYEVEFPAAGEYELYARLRNGPTTYDDDSFYLASGFGIRNIADTGDWIVINGIAGVGYSDIGEVVGNAGSGSLHETWKWLKISGFSNGITFTVPEGELIQDLQIAGREDGLDIDKFVFAPVGTELTVSQLDSGEGPSVTPPPPPAPIAEGKEKFLGNIWAPTQTLNFLHYWNQVSPENGGKWGSVEGTRDVMNWSQLDSAYALAKDNDLPFRMHVMIWGNQQPAWIKSLPQEEQLEEIIEWFAAVAARYADIDQVEVVNEPINDAPDAVRQVQIDDPNSGGYIEALGGTGATGWDWVIKSFELAREHFPNADLIINEYSITNNPARMTQYKEIIQLLQDRDLIDAVGVQAHAFSTTVSAAETKAGLDSLAQLGLPIYVTEMDVDGCVPPSSSTPCTVTQAQSDATQLADYQRIFPIFWEHEAVAGVTLWGFRPGLWRSNQQANLLLANGTERPAIVWLREYVTGEAASSSSSSSVTSSSSSSVAFSSPSLDIPTKKTGGGSTHPLLLLGLMIVAAGMRKRKMRAA